MSTPVEAILIGAGQRGAEVYAPYALAHPDRLRFVAVAEPDEARRARFAARHHILPENQFTSWEALLERPQYGAAALVCTQDWLHTQPALAALRRGYHVLLEKPMATTAADCRSLVQASRDSGRQLHICHVLRYTPHFRKMREIVQSGDLGQVVNVDQRENVGFWHMAHSYVRGNWRNSQLSSPMILTKCCHDLDVLPWVLDRRCERLSSVGSLVHYRPENAPPGAPARCLDGCPASETCPFYAPWFYLTLVPLWRSFVATGKGFEKLGMQLNLRAPGLVKAISPLVPPLRRLNPYREWPLTVVAIDPTPANLEAALRSGPYGRCVYHCDNNVVDHQVVSIVFEGGASVTLTMHGHSHIEYRTTRIEGTRARLTAEFGVGGSSIQVDEHRSGRQTVYDTSASSNAGHGGGDFALLDAFIKSILGDSESAHTTAAQALESHLLAFSAEQARLEKRVVEVEEFRIVDL